MWENEKEKETVRLLRHIKEREFYILRDNKAAALWSYRYEVTISLQSTEISKVMNTAPKNMNILKRISVVRNHIHVEVPGI